MLKKYLHIAFLLFAVKVIPAQVNLVPNPSFEDTLQCPFNPGQIAFASPWYSPNSSSSDYFNVCNTGGMGVPLNDAGNQFARTGNAYSGIYVYFNNVFEWREYIQVKLISQLIFQKNYNIEFHVSLADTFSITSNIFMYFSDTAISAPAGQQIAVIPQFSNNAIANPLTDKNNWTKVSGMYTATGTENYITIGNFYNNAGTDTAFVGGGSYPGSYYYIDDVSIICIDCNDTIFVPNVFTPNNDGENDLFEIKNLPKNASTQIYNRWGIKVFETNKSNTFWDGRTTSGNESVDGTYFYIITTEEKIYKGYLKLIH